MNKLLDLSPQKQRKGGQRKLIFNTALEPYYSWVQSYHQSGLMFLSSFLILSICYGFVTVPHGTEHVTTR